MIEFAAEQERERRAKEAEELLKMQEAMEEEVEEITENPISVEEAVEDKEL